MTIQAPVQLDLFDLLADKKEPAVTPYDDWARCSVIDGHCAGCGAELAPRNGWHAGINHAQVNRPDRYPADVPVCISMEMTLSHYISSMINQTPDRYDMAKRAGECWSKYMDVQADLLRSAIDAFVGGSK